MFIQAIDECEADQPGQNNATEYMQFERHEEKMQIVLARFFKMYLRRHALQVKARSESTPLSDLFFKAGKGAATQTQGVGRKGVRGITPADGDNSVDEALLPSISIGQWGAVVKTRTKSFKTRRQFASAAGLLQGRQYAAEAEHTQAVESNSMPPMQGPDRPVGQEQFQQLQQQLLDMKATLDRVAAARGDNGGATLLDPPSGAVPSTSV